LDYRASAAVEASKRALSAAVRHRERAYQAGAWSMFAVGALALLGGPAMIALCVTSIQYHHHLLGYGVSFALAAITLVPLLFWIERRTRHTTPSDLLRCTSDGECELRRSSGLLELLSWAPRRIISARERLSGTVSAAVTTEAIATINYLRHFDGGVGTDELPTIQPLPVLRYLVSRDWVGVSETGDRVWLLKDARRALGRGFL
jgi:hypothetical protein